MSKNNNINDDLPKIPGLSYDDPLDILGKDPNFLNNLEYSNEYFELSKKWSKLPLYENKKQIQNFFQSIINNQITLVISGTGSGKTVLIPKFLLKYFILNNNIQLNNSLETDNELVKNLNGNIVVTNPKILTTIYNAEYSANTLDVKLGSFVGYKFRGAPDNMSSNDVKLLYSTDGLLLSQILKGDILLSNLQGVIIDEAHERQVPIDLLLYFLKNIVKKRPEFKVIIMSATIDSDIFMKFYEKDNIKIGKIEISGKSNYEITSNYMNPNDKINFFNYMDIGIAIILKILEESESGDILMFVTSQKETEIGCTKLRLLCPNQVKIADLCNTYYCAEVYSKMTDENRNYAVSKDKFKTINSELKRKIIFATNVAESSITLDGIVYVIDSGLELLSYFNYQKYCQVIDKKFTTKAQIKQRMGRAGRTQPGICYHLYTKEKFNKLEDYPNPSISLANLNDNILSFLKYEKYLSNTIFLAKNLITPITPYQLLSSIRYLHFYNLIKIVNLQQNGGSYSDNSDSSDNFNDIYIYEDKLTNLSKVTYTYKTIPYKNMITYNNWDIYEGCLTRFGKIIHDLSGYQIELCMLAFYGKLLSLPMIYSLVSIYCAMDNKLDNLIKFPNNIKNQDKTTFINENFPNAVTYYYSEHLFVYNLLTNYYDMSDKLHLLNLQTFEKSNDIKNNFAKILNKINDEDIDLINTKYNLIPNEINIDDMDMIEKLYLAIFLSHRYNILRLVDIQNKPIFQTQHYIENTSSHLNFNFGKQLDKEDANNYSYGICSNIINIMGKTHINGCTLIPNKFSNKYINIF